MSSAEIPAPGPAPDDAGQRHGAALIAELAALAPAERIKLLFDLSPETRQDLYDSWLYWAHPGQIAPPGDWRVWLIRAGRGFGKTRAGAEWVCEVARTVKDARIALVGATERDVQRVMIEGEAGLLKVAGLDEPIEYRRGVGEVHFGSGAIAAIFSAAAPEALRGPEHHAAWCDELAKWRYGDAAWDNLMLTMRGHAKARVLVTTTPKPITLLHKIIAGKDTVETHGSSRDNPHLPGSFLEAMDALYGGSRLGRQELDGELIDDVEGALWTRAMVEACRVDVVPETVRVVVAVDPPASAAGDACGIIAVALGADEHGYVIEDASVSGESPEGWARAVAACAARVGADRVVAEKNQGGEMVDAVLRTAERALPVKLVHASRGKIARAEPVAALYERGEVHHLGELRALEDELCGMVVGGEYRGPGRSPDRADALVWGITELMLGKQGTARVAAL